MRRALDELGLVLACTASGAALGYAQITWLHMDLAACYAVIFLLAGWGLWLAWKLECRYGTKEPDRVVSATGLRASDEKRARGVQR